MMPRPKRCRRVCCAPTVRSFQPVDAAGSSGEEIRLHVEELEAMRLIDLEGLYQDAAAAQMGVSRRTFGRIIEVAREKVTRALIQGCALRIEGGPPRSAEAHVFRCGSCRHAWEQPTGAQRPDGCPHCHCSDIQGTADRTDAAAPEPDRAVPARRRCCRQRRQDCSD